MTDEQGVPAAGRPATDPPAVTPADAESPAGRPPAAAAAGADPIAKSRAGRDLPAAIAVGLSLAAAVVLTLLYWHWGFVLLVTAMLTLGTVELHDALKRIGMNSAIIPIVAGTVAVICGSYAAATMPQGHCRGIRCCWDSSAPQCWPR